MTDTSRQVVQQIASHIDEVVEKLRSDTQIVKDDLAENYYTKAIIEERFTAGIKTKFVDELPEVGIEGLIYLVPVVDQTMNLNAEINVYKEYLWCNIHATEEGVEPEYQWEAIGSTELKLDDYYTKPEADLLLSEKTNLSQLDVPTKLSDLVNDMNFVTIHIVDELPAVGELNTLYMVYDENYVYEDNKYNEYLWTGTEYDLVGATDNVVQSQLEDYYKKPEVYNKSEVDDAIQACIDLASEEVDEYIDIERLIDNINNGGAQFDDGEAPLSDV